MNSAKTGRDRYKKEWDKDNETWDRTGQDRMSSAKTGRDRYKKEYDKDNETGTGLGKTE